jgi:ABC-type glycerol-3-phosphate transport system substrate-binding protein
MKRTGRTIVGVAAACAVVALVFAATATGVGTRNSASGLGSQYDVSKAGNVTLTLWWLGNQEVPGIEKWMAQTIAAYHRLHPNVTVKTVVDSTDTWTQTQTTACKVGKGPDIWYNWAGTWSLEQAWPGCTVPNEAVLSPTDIGRDPNVAETVYSGQSWHYPLYRFVYPIVYNKTLFKKAGLDTNNPPRTWAQFVAACKKLKAAGTTPIVVGLKDGFGGEILGSGTFQKQIFSDYQKQLIQMVINGDFTTPAWKSWIAKVAEIKPYFNNDVNSITFGDGLARFQNGTAAMVFGTPGVQTTIRDAVKAGMKLGVMKPPVFGSSAYADSLVNTSAGFQVPTWSSHKQVAGNFMDFMHTPDRLKALYAQTGVFPADKAWNTTQATSPTDKLMLKWLAQKGNVYWAADYYPTDLDVNGNFVIFQGILGGKMTVDAAAKTYEDVITKWRKLHGPLLQNYQKWLKK